ncbi:MAG TPA: ABC transporter substrate-binding protein, partial [Candidatus Methylomirabilis sp.]|nr:ABC transporter substrate-binding protein [Candidatus Methylomirabilis sp.]
MRATARVWICLIVLLGLGPPETWAAQPELSLLAVAIGSNMNHVASFVAVEKGFLLKQGLDVKVKVLATGVQMSKAMEAGEVQVIGSAYSNFPVAADHGLAAKGVVGAMGDRTGPTSDENIAIVGRRTAGINRVEDLKGKKLGLAVGGSGDEYATQVLKKVGIARDQVTFLNVPPGNLLAALQSGSVDAIASWEPYPTAILEKVPEAVLVSRGGGLIADIINYAIQTDLIEKNPELVQRYVTGMAEASQYARQHLDEAAEIATRWIPGLDLAVAKKSIRYMTYDPRITRYTLAAWDNNVKILMEQKKLRSALPWQQGVEPRFIEQLRQTQPQLFSDLKPV